MYALSEKMLTFHNIPCSMDTGQYVLEVNFLYLLQKTTQILYIIRESASASFIN